MKLLICQSCGVVIRTRGKHCTGCGVQLALNTPTQMPSFSQVRPPLAVSVKQDHLLLERVVTKRQVNSLTLKPGGSATATPDDGESPSWGEPTYGGNGGNREHGNGGNGGSGSIFGIAPSKASSAKPQDIFLGGREDDNEQIGPSAALLWNADGTPVQLGALGPTNGGSQPQDSAGGTNDFGWTSPKAERSESTSGGAGFFSPSPNSGIYLKSVPDVSETPENDEPQQRKTIETFGKLSLEDSSDNLPALPKSNGFEQFARRTDEPPAETADGGKGGEQAGADLVGSPTESENVSPAPPKNAGTSSSNPIVQVAALSSQPGAAISIAIGGSMAGFMASHLLSSRAAKEVIESKAGQESQAEPVQGKPAAQGAESSGVSLKQESMNTKAAVPSGTAAQESAKQEVPAQKEAGSVEAAQDFGSSIADQSVWSEKAITEPTAESARAEDKVESDLLLGEDKSLYVDRMTPGFSPEGVSPPPNPGKVNPIAVDDGKPADMESSKSDELCEANKNAKSEVEDFFGPESASPKSGGVGTDNRRESKSFFGDDEGGGFDFFSAPSSAAARRPSSTFAETDSPPPDEGKAKANEAGPEPESQAASESSSEPSFKLPSAKPDAAAGGPPPVESEAQERPKVAMPKSITQNRVKLKVDEEAESKPLVPASDKKSEKKASEESEDEESSSKPKSPKRRSFTSGGSSAAKTSSKKSDAKKDSDKDEDEGDKDASSPGGALNWLEEEVSFIGLNVSRKTAGILIAVGAFVLIQIPGWLMSFVHAGGGGHGPVAQQQMPGGMPMQGMPGGAPEMMQGQPQQAAVPGGASGAGQQPGQQGMWAVPVVTGHWKIQTQFGPTVYNGEMNLQQNQTVFVGRGKDDVGAFEIQPGQLQAPSRFMFAKRYDEESRRRGAPINPIVFDVQLRPPDQNGLLSTNIGTWETQVKKGWTGSYFNKSRMEKVTGQWTAQQTARPTAVQGTTVAMNHQQGALPQAGGGFQMPNPFGALDNIQPKPGATTNQSSYKEAQNFFLLVAGVFIAIGITIFMFFLRLFGPGGQMNIWEKEKYIPSQFRALHFKMVREFGRPLKAGSVPLGNRMDWRWWRCGWLPKYLSIPGDIRRANPHILIMGGADKGKTRLMASMVTHDIKSEDRAIIVIDSDGQLSDLVIEWIASQQDGARYAKRVVLVDPTYKAGSLAYNPLEMPEDGDLQAAASAIVHGFKAIYTEPPGAQSQWNAQTANILRNAALLLIANGRTLTDLPLLLQDNDFRDIMLEAVERKKDQKTEYITILETWNQYKKLARTDQWINWVEPILNRVGPMLSDGRIRPILTKPVSDLKLKEIIRNKRILIVKVPQGELDQNANLLGSLMITGLQQATMSLCREGNNKERPVALYVDEMDNFIEKETVENITSETTRFQIGFVATVKTLQHLPEDYRNQLVISMGTMCIFALAKKDGDMLGPQMFRVDGRKIKHQTIQNFFNKVNTSPQFELIMDEEKLNIDRIVGQNEQTYFCYRVGTIAGVFKLRAYDFKDIPEKKINRKLVEKMHAITDSFVNEMKKSSKKEKDD